MVKCYILGAGASYGYDDSKFDQMGSYLRPPLTNDFFKNGYRLGIFTKKQFPNLYSKILDYAILLKKEYTEDISNLDIDVENFLSWLAEKFEESTSISLQSHQRNEEKYKEKLIESIEYQSALGETFYFIFFLLKHYSLLYYPNNDSYQRLAIHSLKEKYNVISLNYDVLFEQAILKSNLDYRYGRGHFPFSIPIAKIHGSINLFNSIGRGIAFSGLIDDFFNVLVKNIYSNRINMANNILIKNPEYLKGIDINELMPSGTEYYEPVIIPPLANYKDYEKVIAYEGIWKLAEEFLRDARDIIFIGCSIREEDEKFIELLSNNIHDGTQIIMVSPTYEKKWIKLKKIKENIKLKNGFRTFHKYSLTL
ncbi:hypothetical protein MCGE09_00204 [Thaumarchaeota archaeon SCGC AB-539-E09]|nr:hypothetical protein MCGE09_00204 [Thaumarchaeota archaeon SCGC AB-539-E09]